MLSLFLPDEMHYFKGPDILLMDTLKIGKKNSEGQSIIQGSGHLFNRKQMPSNYLITKHPNLVLQQKSFKQSLIISQNTLRLYDHFSRFSSVQSLSCVRLFSIPWIAALQASLSITNSWGLLKLMPIESVMPSSHLILCRPLLLPPPVPPSIRVFSNESTLRMRWPKYWSFSFSIRPFF